MASIAGGITIAPTQSRTHTHDPGNHTCTHHTRVVSNTTITTTIHAHAQVVSDTTATTTTATHAHQWAIALAAAMSVESPLLHDQPGAAATQRQHAQRAQRAFHHPDGEPLTLVGVLAWYEAAVNKGQFCRYVLFDW